jgi:hypothetical protein
MASEQAPPECFICTESDPRPHRSACLCTDRYMHTDCFVKMLKAQNGDSKCRVCGALYEDVGWRTRRVVQWTGPCGIVVVLACFSIALAGCAINTAMLVPRLHKSQHAVIALTSSLVLLGLLASVGFIAMQVRDRGCRGVWASRVREEKVVVVGAARLPARVTPAELELGELVTETRSL